MANLSINIVVRIFRRALAFYPADFRERYGDAMLSVFEDSAATAHSESGAWGTMVLLANSLADITITGVAEHFAQIGPAIGITNPVSLAATAAIHTTVLFVLLWLGFHAPPLVPNPDDACSGKSAPSTATKHMARQISR